MGFDRGSLMADRTLTGVQWCRAHSAFVDGWLAELFDRATTGAERSLALVALGGYGRSELCPGSDIDVMLVHESTSTVASVADRLWYPMWDEGLHLGHSVSTIREALRLADSDLDTATTLLSARHVAGDEALTAQLAGAARVQWRKRARRWLAELGMRVELRHEQAGEVAFQLEPDLKEGRGGLRDVHAMHWAEVAQPVLLEPDLPLLARAYATILEARVELQRCTRRPANILALQEQDEVAAGVGATDAEQLMAGVADAARTIAWTSDDAWRRIASRARRSLGHRSRRRRFVESGVIVGPEEIELEAHITENEPALLALRAAAVAARRNLPFERESLERLAATTGGLPDPWPKEARSLFVELLSAGPPAIRVIEALDQRGIWVRILPEWLPIRARPQRNAYHRFTVDRHLLETVSRAARLVDRVGRSDLVVVAALLHDIGKGYDGDHTEVGVELARRIGARMGFPLDDVATLAALVEHHLLLPDVATRRDLDDPVTIERVASAVGTVDRLNMLAVLTQADSLATGPSAWSASKAELVRELVERVTDVLEGNELGRAAARLFPTSVQLERLQCGGQRVELEGDVLTVMTDDRPGILSRVAGVLTLHGVDVVAAAAYSSHDGRALSEFRVAHRHGDESLWARVTRDVERALDGRLALRARVTERARAYARHRQGGGQHPASAVVHIDNDASAEATVIDVHAPDRIGVLYRITSALADLDLDIRSARVQTLGERVVDAFYVRDRRGKITDPDSLSEIERAILHNLSED